LDSHRPSAEKRATWATYQVAAEILRQVVVACGRRGVPVLAVKGVVTAQDLYVDVSERPLADVDVRIRPRDLPVFRRIAADAGWRCSRVALSYRNLVYDFPPLALDVEAQTGPPGLCALTVESMLSRATLVEIAPSLRVLVPEIHDHAVALTVNAFKDKIATANAHALSDLERIVRKPYFQRDRFVELAIMTKAATMTWLVASWLESRRGSEEWGMIRTSLEARARLRRSYGALFRRLLAAGESAGDSRLSLRLLARCGSDDRLMQAYAIAAAGVWEAEMSLRRLPL
jgi:hypothetical protein